MRSPCCVGKRCSPKIRAVRTSDSCESRQPFGCDVVPDVYMIIAGSPTAAATSSPAGDGASRSTTEIPACSTTYATSRSLKRPLIGTGIAPRRIAP